MESNVVLSETIAIIVVAFNAESTLEQVIERIPSTFAQKLTAICICDDASTDTTHATALHCQEKFAHLPIHILRQEKNLGYGGNQKSGYQWAQKMGIDIVILLHADGQYAPELLPQMTEPITTGVCDVVFGSRMMIGGAARKGGMPLYKFVGNKILTRWQNFMAGTDLSEWHSGYRAYSVEALSRIAFTSNSNDFDFDTQIILQLIHSGARIKEIPIPTYYGDEISHVNGMKYGLQVMRETLKFRTRNIGFRSKKNLFGAGEYSLKHSELSSHSITLQFFSNQPQLRVLDLGCSTGELGAMIENLGHSVTGVDKIQPSDFKVLLSNYIAADLNDGVPKDLNGAFDVILCADVLEHLQAPEKLLNELHSLLSPTGEILVSIPNFGHWYPRIKTLTGLFDYDSKGILDHTHLRFFTRRSFQKLAQQSGYSSKVFANTGVPFELIRTKQSSPFKTSIMLVRQIEKLLIRLRPQIFSYQFVLRLKPHETPPVRRVTAS